MILEMAVAGLAGFLIGKEAGRKRMADNPTKGVTQHRKWRSSQVKTLREAEEIKARISQRYNPSRYDVRVRRTSHARPQYFVSVWSPK